MPRIITNSVLKKNKGFKLQLKQAGINQTPDEFITKSFVVSIVLGVLFLGLWIVFSAVLIGFNVFTYIVMIVLLMSPMFFLQYFVRTPKVKINMKQKMIDKDVIFVGRFLLIELSSGVPLYNAIGNASKGFGEISKEFQNLIKKVSLGKPIDIALEDIIRTTPSPYFRKLLWQILNALGTGADIATSLTSILQQISAEQIVDMREYGRKLNPIVMFYLMLTVVVPSLGVVVLTILSMFMGQVLPSGTTVLFFVAFVVGIAQFFFLIYIKNSRPGVSV